jgi:hypothetical protein
MRLVQAIGTTDVNTAARMLRATPELAHGSVDGGATRQEAVSYYFEPINHYVYAGIPLCTWPRPPINPIS